METPGQKGQLRTLGIIGFGDFGRFITPHLKTYFDVLVYSRHDVSAEAAELGARAARLEDVAAADIVVLAVPMSGLENVLQNITSYVRPDALVVDVTSVKVRPLALMENYLSGKTNFLGTHPIFGPQSGKHGIVGLPMVVCPSDNTFFEPLVAFAQEQLKLKVLIKTAEEHDREMAYVQGLTHFISRALAELSLPDTQAQSVSYGFLQKMKSLVDKDSTDLFLTIERENPYAAQARRQFLDALQKVEQGIDDESAQQERFGHG